MRLLFWYLLVNSTLETLLKGVTAKGTPLQKLGFQNAYDKVIRDMIQNWESPIAYLESVGCITDEFKDTSVVKPGLDAIKDYMETKHRKMKRYGNLFSNKPRETHAMNQLDLMLDKIKPKDIRSINTVVGASNHSFGIYPNIAHLMPTQDEQERQLFEMKQRLLPLPVSRLKQEQAETAPKPQVRRFDTMLKHLMMQASPQMKQKEQAHTFESKPNAEDGPQLAPNLRTSNTYGADIIPNLLPVDTNLDTNLGQSSRAEEEAVAANQSKDVEAPSYLNWDIEKKQFNQYSPVAKEAYVNKLVKMFVEKDKQREHQRKLYTSPP
ncbi:uncharacterized protein LOC117592611 [Drosophila guanche]|uniref:Uncharacterized protein n=1 Tax=Drosophila guanche TaxID=7266 RepID=A0A3B0JFS3_DROGU|nr:uncharacterized protein LOC117592611 [Drosophila guanche]SPP74180.1 Hypothetical predicted protein [Drosophila guanche]